MWIFGGGSSGSCSPRSPSDAHWVTLFCCPLWVPVVGGVATAMWPQGGYLNDLHYFSIEAMFAGRVCALSCFCKFLLWISCVHVPVYWVELGLWLDYAIGSALCCCKSGVQMLYRSCCAGCSLGNRHHITSATCGVKTDWSTKEVRGDIYGPSCTNDVQDKIRLIWLSKYQKPITFPDAVAWTTLSWHDMTCVLFFSGE